MNEREMAAGLAETPHYQYAQRVGNRLFVAGQVPRDAQGAIVGVADASAQATQCLRNLSTILSVHGFELMDVREITVYVAGDHEQLLSAWSATTEFFSGQVPPATLLGVARLGYLDQLVEIGAKVVRE